MWANSRRVGGVHLLMVVSGAAMVSALQRWMEEAIPIRLWVDVAGGRAAVHPALVPPLLQRTRPRPRAAALTTHVHDSRTHLTHHASFLSTRTVSPHPYPHFQQSTVRFTDSRVTLEHLDRDQS